MALVPIPAAPAAGALGSPTYPNAPQASGNAPSDIAELAAWADTVSRSLRTVDPWMLEYLQNLIARVGNAESRLAAIAVLVPLDPAATLADTIGRVNQILNAAKIGA